MAIGDGDEEESAASLTKSNLRRRLPFDNPSRRSNGAGGKEAITMRTPSRYMRRRQLLEKAGMAAGSVIAISLGGPAQAASPSQAPASLPNSRESDGQVRVAEQWEDVLLLEAIRYLGLSKTQIQAVLPLAKAAAERLAKLREPEEKKIAVLEPIVQQDRAALLLGKTVAHESDAVLHWQFLRQTRGKAEEEIIQYVAPRLARLLSRPQVLRAFLLARGGALPAQVNSAALLDPSSGFVVDDVAKKRWRDAVVKQQLARFYPPQVLAIDPASLDRRRTFNANGDEVLETMTADERAAEQAQTKKLMLETDWSARWEAPAGRALEAATDDEQVAALYHFVWRTFLSSRLAPVLTERAEQ